jgi:hypothetical protein
MDERRMDTRTQRVRVTKGARSNGPTEYTARVLSARKRALTPRFRDNNLPAFVAPVELFALSPPPLPYFPVPALSCLGPTNRTVYSIQSSVLSGGRDLCNDTRLLRVSLDASADD